MCGIGAIFHKNENINNFLYELLFNLQHRGQDSSGFISYDSKHNITYQAREFGLVENNLFNISTFQGSMGIGHVRYPTHGCITKHEIQPFFEDSFGGISLSHNGNITNCDDIIKILNDNNITYVSTSDSEIILKYFILLLKKYISKIDELVNEIIYNIVKTIYDTCRGSYSIIIMINNYGIICFRDIYGIRPLVYTTTKNYLAIASETIAFVEDNNYNNINNGEVIIDRKSVV